MSDCGESKEDGQKVVTTNTEVRNCSSGVKCIGGGTIWPRRKEKMGEEEEEEEEGREEGGEGVNG